MIYDAPTTELDAIMTVARLMMAAARTAPKGKGADNLTTMLFTGGDKDRVADQMEQIAREEDIPFFQRDAKNIRFSPVVMVLGSRLAPLGIPHCGYCGYQNCGACKEADGRCNFNIIDLGIALGSAVSVAALHHIDNRIMFSFGKTVLEMGLLPEETRIAYGIPLSISSKSPFFDR
ncbi:MAG: ferredoxin [Deltaproteobacteria bacterium]|nr:ferredoxin [Candidatus Anaeroferrophillus wilburensis]MBN2888291.1 ferredoxin [Deltaproteobacteria bacterium]